MMVEPLTDMKLLKTGTTTMYLEVTELTAGEVERRFIQKDLGIINEIEVTLIEFANGNTEKGISPDLELYLRDDLNLKG